MFGNVFKKILPVAALAVGAGVGAKYLAGTQFGSNLFASSSIKDKIAQWGLKKGMVAAFGGEDGGFSSPNASAGVDFSSYMRSIPAGSQGCVVGFPGPIKTADPETIAYIWKQRMNSYVGKA